MTNEDRPEFAEVITALFVTFNREADKPALAAYWMALDDLELSDVQQAVRRAMRECKFCPTAAELRELGGAIAPSDRAALAWEAFDRAVGQVGGYASVDFADDPVINATVANLGGWERVTGLVGDEYFKWLRKDLERVYATLMRTGAPADRCSALVGICEARNTLEGHEQPKAVRFLTGLPPHRKGIVGPRRDELPAGERELLDCLGTIGHLPAGRHGQEDF
jgi:hypothetical protein